MEDNPNKTPLFANGPISGVINLLRSILGSIQFTIGHRELLHILALLKSFLWLLTYWPFEGPKVVRHAAGIFFR